MANNNCPYHFENLHLFFQVIQTGLQNFFVDWTNSGELLAVAGKHREIANRADHTIRYMNVIHFYDEGGQLLYRSKIPSEMVRA